MDIRIVSDKSQRIDHPQRCVVKWLLSMAAGLTLTKKSDYLRSETGVVDTVAVNSFPIVTRIQ